MEKLIKRIDDAIASNDYETLDQLSTHKDDIIRFAVTFHKNTPIHILELLASDENKHVRINVARHKNTPIHILESLSKDEEEYVRLGVAENPNTPVELSVELLKELSKSDDLNLLKMVENNPNFIGYEEEMSL